MKWRIGFVLGWLAAFVVGAQAGASERVLLLATTTSVRDTGLLDELLPLFEERTGIRVKVIAVGTGAALRMAAEADVDAVLTHAPEAERALVEQGAIVDRRPFMENFFVLAGPPEDPAGIGDAPSATDAYRRLAQAAVPYVSRGDDSGTHKREKALLAAAGLPDAEAWDGFMQTGAGMGLSLQVAGQRRAYILSDVGTFLAYAKRTGLVALSRPSPELRNVYSVARVNPERLPQPDRGEMAKAFADHLVESDTLVRIGRFGTARFGRPLFVPLPPPGAGGAGPDSSADYLDLPWPLVAEITARTLRMAAAALAIALAVGLPLGIALGRARFRGRGAVVGLVNAGMGAPPVVVGLAIALLLWRTGPLGSLDLMYSMEAMVIAQALIALPLVTGISLAAVGALDPDWELQARTLGIPRPWRLWLLLREIRLGLLAAVIAALGSILSGVGAVLMVGGNLAGETRVLTTSIVMFTEMGEFERSIALACVLLGLMLVLSALLTTVQQGGRR